ncbi:MAG: hypothetical protein ABFS86_17560 [Planctomycetota bacterium]
MDRRRILALTLSLLLLASCGGGGSVPAGGGGGGGSSDGPVGRIPPLDPGEVPEPAPAFEWRFFSSTFSGRIVQSGQ